MILVDSSGAVRSADDPLIHADDLGMLRGDGVFETILVRDGRARLLDAHLARLQAGAGVLELPPPDLAALRGAVGVAVDQWGVAAEGAVRIVYSRGRESVANGPATWFVTVSPLPQRSIQARRDGVRVLCLDRADHPAIAERSPWELLGVKALSYARNMAAIRYATAQGFDDALYLASTGAVLESPRATVVAALDGELTTPRRSAGILPGTTQAALFDAAAELGVGTSESQLSVADLRRADGVWLLSALSLAARVTSIDSIPLADVAATTIDVPKMVSWAVDRAMM